MGRRFGAGRRLGLAALVATGIALLFPVTTAEAALTGPADTGTAEVYLVQGVTGQVLDIQIDGRRVSARAESKAVIGPLELTPGNHELTLRRGSQVVASSTFAVDAGHSLDVVAYQAADDPEQILVTAYRNDLSALVPGKVRLVAAYTAAAPPADLTVGDVVFSNLINGEELAVVVPSGSYQVNVFPAATTARKILGPVELSLRKSTLTRIFVVGDGAAGSIDAIVHSLPVKTAAAFVPRSVPTADGGLFTGRMIGDDTGSTEAMMASAIGLTLVAGLVGLVGRRLRGRSPR